MKRLRYAGGYTNYTTADSNNLFSVCEIFWSAGECTCLETVKSTKHILRKAHSTLYSAEANEPKRNIAESS